MTPKEKAFELANKYRLLEIRLSETKFMMISMADAKQCALIVVNEILDYFKWEKSAMKFWQEVKQEINKL